MRCSCCNKALNDWESTARGVDGGFLDTCRKCLKGLQVATIGRPDLNPEEAAPDSDDFDIESIIDEYEDYEDNEDE